MAQAVSRQPPNHVGPGSVSVQSIHDLWWRGWHWDRFYSGYFGFLLSLSFHQYPILIIYTLLLSGQTAEVWEPFKKRWSFGIWRVLDREILFISLYRINKRCGWLYAF